MPRPGGRPTRAVNACTAGIASARIAAAIAVPSRIRALTKTPWPRPSSRLSARSAVDVRGSLQLPETVGAAEDHEVVARPHRRLGRRVEIHMAVGAPDPDDHHAVLLPQAGVEPAPPAERRRLAAVTLVHPAAGVSRRGPNL